MSAGEYQPDPGADSAHSRQASPALDSHPQTDRLVDWFRANDGRLSPDVQIAYHDSSGFHLRALRPLKSSVVVTCPIKLTLSHLNLDHTQSVVTHVDSPLEELLGVLSNHVLTRLLLIEQRHLAQQGEGLWHPYMACLPEPEAMTASIWFNDDDMEWLTGTNLAAATKSTLAVLTEEWEHAVKVLRDANISIPGLLDLHLFRWAATIMSSRSFSSERFLPDRETFPILFPVLDILNHSLHANIEWDARPFEDFSLKRVNHDAVQPGEEIFNNYFPKQNGEWLLAYGFCLPGNPVEQFAIKMGIPPPVEEAFKRVGLYDKQNVPFGMSTGFLEGDPNKEQHYLRTEGHPFGRYKNYVPFFSGIPPWIVHLHFIMAIQNTGKQPAHISKSQPPPRLVFDILLKLYEAIDLKSQALPLTLTPEKTPRNDRQKYASIYRDGQAKIIHAIREELWAVLAKLMLHNELPSWKPVVISTTEALIAMQHDFPESCKAFQKGLQTYYDISPNTLWPTYTTLITTLQEADHPAELTVWKILIFTLTHLYIKAPPSEQPHRLTHCWIRDLIPWVGVPPAEALEDEEPALTDEVLADFVLHGSTGPVAELDGMDVVPEYGFEPAEEGKQERLGGRAALWAEEVVERCAFQIKGCERVFMYMAGNENMDWIYKHDV